jgi:glycosyltransferase involved in cell wall biosynthesis
VLSACARRAVHKGFDSGMLWFRLTVPAIIPSESTRSLSIPWILVQALAARLACGLNRRWPDRPVSVALVITDLDVGGAERALVSLALGLDRRRWSPSVIALGEEGALAEPLRAERIDTRCLRVDRRRPVQAVFRLAGALRARSPALVQSFLFHANLAAKLAAPMAGAPWVVGGLRVAEKRQRWHLTLDLLTSRLATGSVCVSEGVRRFSQEVGRLSANRLYVIPNGIDVSEIDRAPTFDRELLNISSNAFLVLFVGRIDAQKGVDTLIDAAERILESTRDWHLAIAGDGPGLAALSDRTKDQRALSSRIHWLGRRDDVPSLMKAADLLVLSSRWEGMPNVVLEAMAARRAVLATAVEGTTELVIPGETGWLVPPEDAESLASALIEACGDRARLRRFGENGRRRVEAEFLLDQMIAAFEQLWARVLGYSVVADT